MKPQVPKLNAQYFLVDLQDSSTSPLGSIMALSGGQMFTLTCIGKLFKNVLVKRYKAETSEI